MVAPPTTPRSFAVDVARASAAFQDIARQMGAQFLDKQEIIRLMTVSAIAGEHMVIVGPPGTAKSAMIDMFAKLIDAKYFEYLLTRFTEPNELFGPFDIRKLREGDLVTNTEGMLPEASFVFLDELLNANSADLWILSQTPSGPRLQRVGTVEQSRPDWKISEPGGSKTAPTDAAPIVQLDAERSFIFRRLPGSLTPVIEWQDQAQAQPDRFVRELLQIENDLFRGQEAVEVRDRLEILAKYPGLLCRGTWSCDRYYYLLGLANELAKNERGAIAAYLTLWRNYLRSPFTTMARLKLIGGALPLTTPVTPTFTPIPSATGGATATSTPKPVGVGALISPRDKEVETIEH